MLPISTAQPQAYAAKMLRFRHMDFEYALWLMANLCISPRTAFRSTLYHSRTKHQWARDDPAFLIILLYLLIVATVAWSLAFAQRTPLQVVGLMLYVVTVDFLLLGAAVATVSWWLANTYLHERARAPTDWGAVADAESSVSLARCAEVGKASPNLDGVQGWGSRAHVRRHDRRALRCAVRRHTGDSRVVLRV